MADNTESNQVKANDTGYIIGYASRGAMDGGLKGAGLAGAAAIVYGFIAKNFSFKRSFLIKTVGVGALIGGLLGFARSMSDSYEETHTSPSQTFPDENEFLKVSPRAMNCVKPNHLGRLENERSLPTKTERTI